MPSHRPTRLAPVLLMLLAAGCAAPTHPTSAPNATRPVPTTIAASPPPSTPTVPGNSSGNSTLAPDPRTNFTLALAPVGGALTTNFTRVQIAVYAITLDENGSRRLDYAFDDANGDPQPLVVELVALARGHANVTLAIEELPPGTLQNVTLHLDLISATGTDGGEVPTCPTDGAKPTGPCVSVPANGAVRHENASTPLVRGEKATFVFGLGVRSDSVDGNAQFSFEDETTAGRPS